MDSDPHQARYDEGFRLGREYFSSTKKMFPSPFEPAPGVRDEALEASYLGWMDGTYDAYLQAQSRAACERGTIDALAGLEQPAPYAAGSAQAKDYAIAWIATLIAKQEGYPVVH